MGFYPKGNVGASLGFDDNASYNSFYLVVNEGDILKFKESRFVFFLASDRSTIVSKITSSTSDIVTAEVPEGASYVCISTDTATWEGFYIGTGANLSADAFKLPPEERAKVRSKTFPGIARAMAEQWGNC